MLIIERGPIYVYTHYTSSSKVCISKFGTRLTQIPTRKQSVVLIIMLLVNQRFIFSYIAIFWDAWVHLWSCGTSDVHVLTTKLFIFVI